ncbi:hypothetical protein [Companilactobacillus heilongjiangensis]|uniref:LXG domain-containing protein n=1 Tax=Companilactobacillus heilongjiangensis TaxID=1074467 RepID=A0A0K2LCD7_9LACO|nr:hypothetical protein [Companilactobacillus heilongjiangensis]ALB28961.1 hypothetical protein JP39_06075 [Companilactobacillus heilongjiangensis]
MTAMTSRYRILETNVLLERFVTYNEVFMEHFKTMKIIERGEALRYETYSRLADNYLSNIDRFMKLCNSYIEKYNLQNSPMAEKLNNYFINLIDALNCLDTENNALNQTSMEQARSKIKASQEEFVNSINVFIK